MEFPFCLINCGGAAIFRCSSCHSAAYCSQDCQKSDWKKHKTECPQIRDGIFARFNQPLFSSFMSHLDEQANLGLEFQFDSLTMGVIKILPPIAKPGSYLFYIVSGTRTWNIEHKKIPYEKTQLDSSIPIRNHLSEFLSTNTLSCLENNKVELFTDRIIVSLPRISMVYKITLKSPGHLNFQMTSKDTVNKMHELLDKSEVGHRIQGILEKQFSPEMWSQAMGMLKNN